VISFVSVRVLHVRVRAKFQIYHYINDPLTISLSTLTQRKRYGRFAISENQSPAIIFVVYRRWSFSCASHSSIIVSSRYSRVAAFRGNTRTKSAGPATKVHRKLCNGAWLALAMVTAPPGPSLIINNFPLAAPGLHVYGPCRDRAGLAARVLSVIDRRRGRCCLPSSGRYFHGDQSEPALSPFETRPSLLSVVVLFDKQRPSCARFLRESCLSFGPL